MLRKIIQIDEEKCTGCGLCAAACHEGAIAMVDGKAKLIRDDYCDGLGDCLPACPAEAIHFTIREAAAYDEAAVLEHKQKKLQSQEKQEKIEMQKKIENSEQMNLQKKMENPKEQAGEGAVLACGCPGTQAKKIERTEYMHGEQQDIADFGERPSRLSQWPVQIKLAPVNAPYFKGAKLLVAADCTAYAYANFHEKFIKGRITLAGCPKLDNIDYSEKLTEILKRNDIRDVTIVRMEVPCCGGLEKAVRTALQSSGKWIPWQVVTISTDGRILD